MHNGLVRLVPEVRLIPLCEVRGWPLLHLRELLLRRPNLDSSINTVSSQWSSALFIPLFEHLLLHLGISTDEVIKRLDVRLGSVHREGQIVVLEVAANTGEVDQRLYTSPTQLLGVTKARTLENQWGTHGACADDDLLSGFEDPADWLASVEGLGWHCYHTDSPAILNNHFLHLGVALEVEVGVLSSGAVDIGVGGITSAS